MRPTVKQMVEAIKNIEAFRLRQSIDLRHDDLEILVEIAELIKTEAAQHGLLQETLKTDILPAIAISGKLQSFRHSVNCKCGYQYELTTQHSASTQAGGIEIHQALFEEAQQHVVTSCAAMIYEWHKSKQ